MACNSKMAGRRANKSEIGDVGVVDACIWGTFDLLVFRVILGSFGAIVSKWHVPQKRLSVE